MLSVSFHALLGPLYVFGEKWVQILTLLKNGLLVFLLWSCSLLYSVDTPATYPLVPES